MSAAIYVELPADSVSPLRIGQMRNGKIVRVRADESGTRTGVKAVAFAPALAVARFDLPLAARSEAEARKAALYAVEDELAQPVEDVSLTLGPRNPVSGLRAVYIVDSALLRSWCERLDAAGLGHALIVPEQSLALDVGSVSDLGDRLLLAGKSRIVGVDAALPAHILRTLTEAAGVSDAPVEGGDSLSRLAALYMGKSSVSLVRPAGTNALGQKNGRARAWLLAAGLAAACFLVWISSVLIETGRLSATATTQTQTASEQFRAQFPGVPQPVDVHNEVRLASKQLGASPDEGFTHLSAAMLQAIALSPGTSLRRLSYAGAGSGLRAELRLADAASEALLRAALEAEGYSVEIAPIGASEDRLQSSVTIRVQP